MFPVSSGRTIDVRFHHQTNMVLEGVHHNFVALLFHLRTVSVFPALNRTNTVRMQRSVVAMDTVGQAQEILLSAAENRDQDPDAVIEAIR